MPTYHFVEHLQTAVSAIRATNKYRKSLSSEPIHPSNSNLIELKLLKYPE